MTGARAIRRSAFAGGLVSLGGLASLGLTGTARAAGFGRALIVANLTAECDALEAACSYHRRTALPIPFERVSTIPGMRGRFVSANGSVEVWCIQDLVPAGADFRSTAVQARILPPVVGGSSIALIGAFGTAASTLPETQNGNVIIGTNTFLHDPHAADSTSHWRPRAVNTLVTSALDVPTFQNVIGSVAERNLVAPYLLTSPLAPVRRPVVIADRAFVAISDINVTKPADYALNDRQAISAYKHSGATAPIGSLETTHAVIRACTSAPFFFVSGITNRVGAFESEVAPRADAQTFVAAFNAGLAVAAMAIRMLYTLAR